MTEWKHNKAIEIHHHNERTLGESFMLKETLRERKNLSLETKHFTEDEKGWWETCEKRWINKLRLEPERLVCRQLIIMLFPYLHCVAYDIQFWLLNRQKLNIANMLSTTQHVDQPYINSRETFLTDNDNYLALNRLYKDIHCKHMLWLVNHIIST